MQVEEQTASLEFTAIEAVGENIFYYAIDTAEAGAEAKAAQWFTQVQKPE